MQRIPFVPFPLYVARKIVRPFYGLGERIAKFFPSLGAKLIQAEINLHPREYVAVAVFTAWFWLLFVFGFFFFVFYSLGLTKNLVYALVFSSVAIGIMSFFYVLIYPNFLVSRKVRDGEIVVDMFAGMIEAGLIHGRMAMLMKRIDLQKSL